MNSTITKLSCGSALVLLAFTVDGLVAPTGKDSIAQNVNNTKTSPATVTQLLRALEEKDQVIADHETRLDEQKREIDELKSLVQQLINNKTQPQPQQAENSNQKNIIPPKTEDVKHVGLERRQMPKTQPPKIAAVENDGGVVLAPGKMVIEPSVEYSRSSSLRVAIEGFTIIPALSIGSFEVSQVNRDTLTNAMTFRLGLVKGFEMSARIPYVLREDATTTRPIGTGSSASLLRTVSGSSIGDAEISGSYQLNNGTGGWPFFIANLRFKSATGTSPFDVALDPATGLPLELSTGSGFYAIQPSVTAVFPSDPAVLYSTLGYVYNMAKQVGGAYGEIDPGDSINYSLGMGFGINDSTSFSLAYSHDIVFETTQNGASIPTSSVLQIGQMSTGISQKINDRVNLNFNVSAGLTDDAPDMRVGVKVPVKMDLW